MIVDCFTFYNEVDILKKRLKYLSPVVDKFVLVESTKTFRGNSKELFYEQNKKDFDEWKDKIIHVIVEDNPDDKNPWVRETHQRNCITRGLTEISVEDLVMISDVDEIPNRELIKMPEDVKACSFNMIAFQYNFDYMQELEPWFGTVLTRKKVVDKITPQKLRDLRWSVPCYRNAGWHLSAFGDEHYVSNKIHNYSHCYDDKHMGMNTTTFKNFIKNGIHTDGKYKLVKTSDTIKNSLPNDLKNN